jgi:hypothetical protein
MGPVGMSEFDFGLKRYIPKTASPITIAAISTHLVVLLIRIRLSFKWQIYLLDTLITRAHNQLNIFYDQCQWPKKIPSAP